MQDHQETIQLETLGCSPELRKHALEELEARKETRALDKTQDPDPDIEIQNVFRHLLVTRPDLFQADYPGDMLILELVNLTVEEENSRLEDAGVKLDPEDD